MTGKRQFEISDDDLITRREVEQMTGLRCSSIYKYSSLGTFPPPLKISKRSVRWRRGDIKAWRNSLQPKYQPPRAEVKKDD